MKKFLKGKMSISHIFFMAAFSAIVNTIISHNVNWDNRYITGLIAGLVTFIGGILAIFIIKND
ncbi:hypothetical protein [Gottfriedia solisilvae]|uniref:Uncharacterized protein n=1 Tax=Gottfriedia solisilvae TaxID=1516104 RepID=A0A8J3EWM4_9BACI|nr:hypothetical protein [Gottfriedia solisilvae]GGI11536.1 hypothetical protein GCM10007380_08330 [Gottfriedia solisilvae]